MPKLFKVLKSLVPSFESHQDRAERYLSQAVDIYDLERRMRELDARNRSSSHDLTFALGLR